MIDTNLLTCKVYNSFEEISNIQEEWDNFLLDVDGDIYLSFDWCKIWWDYYGKKRSLRIYLFHQDNRLVGVIPIFYETQWIGPVWLKMAKMLGSDFTISMMNPPVRADYAASIFRCVIDSLIKRKAAMPYGLGL